MVLWRRSLRTMVRTMRCDCSSALHLLRRDTDARCSTAVSPRNARNRPFSYVTCHAAATHPPQSLAFAKSQRKSPTFLFSDVSRFTFPAQDTNGLRISYVSRTCDWKNNNHTSPYDGVLSILPISNNKFTALQNARNRMRISRTFGMSRTSSNFGLGGKRKIRCKLGVGCKLGIHEILGTGVLLLYALSSFRPAVAADDTPALLSVFTLLGSGSAVHGCGTVEVHRSRLQPRAVRRLRKEMRAGVKPGRMRPALQGGCQNRCWPFSDPAPLTTIAGHFATGTMPALATRTDLVPGTALSTRRSTPTLHSDKASLRHLPHSQRI